MVMEMFGRLKELLKIEPLIISGVRIEDESNRTSQIFVKEYQGHKIHIFYGHYNKDLYKTTMSGGSLYYGNHPYGYGYYVVADNFITCWVRVQTTYFSNSIQTRNSEQMVKKGIAKAIQKIESRIDKEIKCDKNYKKRHEGEKEHERDIIDAVSRSYGGSNEAKQVNLKCDCGFKFEIKPSNFDIKLVTLNGEKKVVAICPVCGAEYLRTKKYGGTWVKHHDGAKEAIIAGA